MGRKRRNRQVEAQVLDLYMDGDFSVEQGQEDLRISRSTFFRRLRCYRSGRMVALKATRRGKPSVRGRAYWAVKHQVLELYRKGPSRFCSYFYSQNRHRFVRKVGYSTVRKWLREAGLLRRPPSLIGRPESRVWSPRRKRGLTYGEKRERWKDIWRGWERPGYGVREPTRAQRESWARHVENLAPLTPFLRRSWVPPETPWDELSFNST